MLTRKIIFLDFDGVLNTESYFQTLMQQGVPTHDEFGVLFDSNSVAKLAEIINLTNAQIVVSSSWRYMGVSELQRMWKLRKLPGKIVGFTPLNLLDEELLTIDLDNLDSFTPECLVARGSEIQAWLDNHTGIANYLILDDLTDILPSQKKHFVQINPIKGITKENVVQALQILQS